MPQVAINAVAGSAGTSTQAWAAEAAAQRSSAPAHFDGTAVLHWPPGSGGQGALLTGDTITAATSITRE